MYLRSLELKHFGRFDAATFDLRRGPNLVVGPTDSGKSTLLAAVSAALFGVADRERFRTWGGPAACAAVVVFEAAGRTLRIERDLLGDQVTAVVADAAGKEIDRFAAVLPAGGASAEHLRYGALLGRFFGGADAGLLRAALTGVADPTVPPAGPAAAEPDPDPGRELAAVQQRLGELEKAWYDTRRRMGELPPLRERISALSSAIEAERAGQPGAEAPPPPVHRRPVLVPAEAGGAAPTRREALERELARTGLPHVLPPGLPELLEQAGAIRAEMIAIQTEVTALRQQLQERPGVPWRAAALFSLLAAGAGGSVGWLAPYWLPAGLAVGGVVALVPLLYCLWRGLQERSGRRVLETQVGALEEQREAAQGRLSRLDDNFRRLGLSPSAVEIVRMQKNLERHRQLLRELAAEEAGGGEGAAASTVVAAAPPAEDADPKADELAELRRQEAELAALPQELRRIEEEGEQLREREGELIKRGTVAVPPSPPAGAAGAGSERLHPLAAETGRYLAQLSAGRYGEARLGADGGWSLRAEDGAWRPLAHFSGGAAACLHLAVQIALSRPAGVETPLPLLLDEPLVPLDRPQAAEALRLLERLAAEQQVILCTRDEGLPKRARDRWQVLPLVAKAEKKTEQSSRSQERNDDDGQLHLL